MNDMQQYKKSNARVPNGIKYEIPAAVKEPSQLIMEFLKKDEEFVDKTLLNIFHTLLEKFKTNDDTKKAKYIKKTKSSTIPKHISTNICLISLLIYVLIYFDMCFDICICIGATGALFRSLFSSRLT